jgi:NADH:ubiquinone oxidoreductase subunit 5 (subunit L)/multisubunit Na+/H+ antiporter MnhA subunit
MFLDITRNTWAHDISNCYHCMTMAIDRKWLVCDINGIYLKSLHWSVQTACATFFFVFRSFVRVLHWQKKNNNNNNNWKNNLRSISCTTLVYFVLFFFLLLLSEQHWLFCVTRWTTERNTSWQTFHRSINRRVYLSFSCCFICSDSIRLCLVSCFICYVSYDRDVLRKNKRKDNERTNKKQNDSMDGWMDGLNVKNTRHDFCRWQHNNHRQHRKNSIDNLMHSSINLSMKRIDCLRLNSTKHSGK